MNATTPIGIITKQSPFTVNETINRLQNLLRQKGVTIYARINQQQEAEMAGLALLPVELLIFGNPKAGVPLMRAVPLSAIDLPLKALAWADNENNAWLSYVNTAFIQQRFGLPRELVEKIDITLLIEQALQA